MNLGTNEIKGIYVGSTPAQAYLGTTKVWPEEEPAVGYWGLCFTAEEPSTDISMAANGTAPSITLFYSTDGDTWSTFTPGTTTVTLANVGDKVWLKAGPNGNSGTALNANNYWKFVTSKNVACGGNVMSLLDGSQQTTSILQDGALASLFRSSKITSAPALPATTLAADCYSLMFYSCISLTSAPALPATTLANACYNTMFYSCISLTSAPALPATTLAERCYSSMFYNCINLSSINVAFTSWTSATNPAPNWVRNVASTGTFTCPTILGTNETIARGLDNCPANWTVINTDVA